MNDGTGSLDIMNARSDAGFAPNLRDPTPTSMEEMRDPSVAVLSGLCLAVSASTFLIAALLLVRKGLRAAPFYGSVLAIVTPGIIVDVMLYSVDSPTKMKLWYLVRASQLVFSSTLIVIVSFQRLKVFTEAGLTDWLTDRRLRVALAFFLVVRVVLVTQFIRAYANMDPGQPWDVPMERLMLSTLIIGGDAIIDLVCTVVAFILVLRVRVAILHARERRSTVKGAPTAHAAGRRLHKDHRFLALLVGIVVAQMVMILNVVAGAALAFFALGFKGDEIGLFLQRIYMLCSLLQWHFTTELVKNHKAKTLQVSASSTGPDTKPGLSINAKSLLDMPRLLSKRVLPSPVVPLLGTSGETMPQVTTTLDTMTTTARTSTDGLPVVGAANGS
ncbi:hypothetical protein AMAG_15913 [Allomyces macrogynus ATCC 38327]|uniref:Uncharacterized protein n=1 Tax=Allomyces macrogynus (strain ATCC 38327) TaxID=578462 RepID=A0A0L0TB84_ALLM3|nr:hypothetical protein AMAG_15913 [Allomyces macrogynus ATCC 38327]|eukprot:KNE71971.1 hypothetical protein AMAG_15913 [Allomyces macrogynus ATCC 38327]